MPDLPVILKLHGQRCVVVGGGPVALRRVNALLAAGAKVTVISPEMDEAFNLLPEVTRISRKYEPGDLAGAKLVVIATNDPAANAAAAGEARAINAMVNRADAPDESDISIPSHSHHGLITIAVHTHGVSAAAAAAIRRELSASLRAHWEPLLEAASQWRSRIQQALRDPEERQRRLTALTGPQAITILQTHGREALLDFYAALANPAIPYDARGDAT